MYKFNAEMMVCSQILKHTLAIGLMVVGITTAPDLASLCLVCCISAALLFMLIMAQREIVNYLMITDLMLNSAKVEGDTAGTDTLLTAIIANELQDMNTTDADNKANDVGDKDNLK